MLEPGHGPRPADEAVERMRAALERTGARAVVEAKIAELAARVCGTSRRSGADARARQEFAALVATGRRAPAPERQGRAREDRAGADGPRRRGRRRPVRARRRPAPARRGPPGDRRRTGRRPGRPGGPRGTRRLPLDTGPTVLTMPHLVDEAFAAVGDSLADRVELVAAAPRLPGAVRRRQPRWTSTPTPRRWRPRSSGSPEPREAAGYRRLRALAGAAVPGADAPLHRHQLRLALPAAAPGPGPAGGARRLRPAGRPRSAASSRDERLRRVFSFQALYAGVAPARALAAYAVIAYMDTVAGVWFPRGGMHAAAPRHGGRGRRRRCRPALRPR